MGYCEEIQVHHHDLFDHEIEVQVVDLFKEGLIDRRYNCFFTLDLTSILDLELPRHEQIKIKINGEDVIELDIDIFKKKLLIIS